MKLKEFQQTALDVLESYARHAREVGAFHAFNRAVSGALYREPKDAAGNAILPGSPPYVCVRVPTGGGKTLLAASAVGPILHAGLERERSVVLWLVPSRAIGDQTLKALRNPRHPYRIALASSLGSEAIQVMDATAALSLSRAVALGETVVIVATLQSFRQEQTDGRKVYEDNGQLFAFRDDLAVFDAAHPGVLERLEGSDQPRCSLRNVLAMHEPLVILDEAHNARTSLSFDTLARLRPAWILELTATPDREHNASNVLHAVFASDLKHAGLIKLPVEVESASTPEDALLKAKAHREILERMAQALPDRYLRPICLIQAEPDAAGNEWTVKRVRDYLMADLDIPGDQVVVHTGNDRGIAGIDLFSRSQPIRYIVTQKALAEGWDCSFAYVLCALASAHSAKDVEQLLGRVLRLPEAAPFATKSLNQAYAIIRSSSFMQTVSELRERMVKIHGFEGVPKEQIIHTPQQPLPLQEQPQGRPAANELLSGIAFEQLPERIRDQVTPQADGRIAVPLAVIAANFEAFALVANNVPALHAKVRGLTTPSGRGLQLRIPQLLYCGKVFAESALSVRPLPVDDMEPDIAVEVLGLRQVAHIDAEGHDLTLNTQQGVRESDLPFGASGHDDLEILAYHLDHLLHGNGKHPDVTSAMGRRYCLRALRRLQSRYSIAELDRARYRIANAISAKWDELRERLRKQMFQTTLLDQPGFSTDAGRAFVFPAEQNYLPRATESSARYRRHLYKLVGLLNSEERQVALALDSCPHVKLWARNLANNEGGNASVSFTLQLSTDKFYPDFVAQLNDGRTVVIEYKGDHLTTNADSEEKRAVGAAWARASGGLFEWVTRDQLPDLGAAWASRFAAERRSRGVDTRPPGSVAAAEKVPGVCGGRAVVAGTRIPVWAIQSLWLEGANDAEVVIAYPSLEGADFDALRRYVAEHDDEITADITDQSAE